MPGTNAGMTDTKPARQLTGAPFSFYPNGVLTRRVPVAQRTERLPSKQMVAGSNPAWDAILYAAFGVLPGGRLRFRPLALPPHHSDSIIRTASGTGPGIRETTQ